MELLMSLAAATLLHPSAINTHTLSTDKKIKQFVQSFCEDESKGCREDVTSCFKSTEKTVNRCRKKYPVGQLHQMIADDSCAETMLEFAPLNQKERVELCIHYYLEKREVVK